MEYYRLKFQFYGCKADSREDAIRRGAAKVKADPDGFVVDAEKPPPKRSLVGRFFLGG